MKSIFDMSDEEIVNLSDEEIETQVKLTMAKEGVQFPEPVTFAEEISIPEPELDMYSCNLFDNYGFATMEDLQEVLNVLDRVTLYKQDYDYSVGYDIKYRVELSSDAEELVIRQKKLYSKEDYLNYSQVLIDNKKIKKENDKLTSAYKSQMAEASEVRKRVDARIHDAISAQSRKERYSSLYEEYLELAEGSTSIALRFLVDAYKPTKEQLLYIQKKHSFEEKLLDEFISEEKEDENPEV